MRLYLHVPFCRRKCAYCSFYSLEKYDAEEYIASIIRAVQFYGGKTLDSVYIGGGTPSVLSPSQLTRLMNAVRESFSVPASAEITVEANPESCTAEFIAAAKAAGINRLSLGVQSLDDRELSAVGRLHDAVCALSATERALAAFDNVSCDLIFGLPGQTVRSFSQSLDALISRGVPHISCYNLQVEKGTPLFERGVTVPDEEAQERLYFLACDRLRAAGYRHYEISNFAKPGFESRHNSAYWTGEDYLGLGPAAHSKLGDTRCSFAPDIAAFCAKTDFEFDSRERIDDPLFERIMLSLRTDRGLETALLPHSADYIERLCEGGFASVKNGVLALTDRGFYLSNTIISDLAARECNNEKR